MRHLRRNRSTTEDAKKALDEARRNVKRVKQRSEEVSEVAGALKNIRERNHFADQLLELMVPYPEGKKS